jgi:Holliday junction resolvase RusA-like endonuclease
MIIKFDVAGKPVPRGSKRAFPIRRKDGSLGVAVSDNTGERGRLWMAMVQDAARSALPADWVPRSGPVRLFIVFQLRRPKAHYTTRGAVKSSAPAYPIVRPDLTKLLRAIEDALTGVVWRDDSQIVFQAVSKEYADADGTSVVVEFA